MTDDVYLSEAVWREQIRGWHITDCAVRSRTFVSLCLRQALPEDQASRMWDHDIPAKLFVLNLAKPGTDFGARTLTGYNKPKLGVALEPKAQSLLVARNNDGQVSVLGGGAKFPDEFIAPGKVPLTARVKTLFGHAYSVGGGRAIYKRQDIGRWVRHDTGLPQVEASRSQGFNDMDAFSENDMYAVGGHGDVWHFDGAGWQQMGFPSNVRLATVTCAGDGRVYISGEGGSLWVGEHSTWEPLHRGSASVLWNDVLWFDNRLWLASDYQLRIWNGKALEPVSHEGRDIHLSGHMDARDGLLAIASLDAVKTFDGRAWRTLVAPYAD